LFRLKPANEIERVQDVLRKNIKFENASFNRDNLYKVDLFRTANSKKWISPRGFESATKVESLSPFKGKAVVSDTTSDGKSETSYK
jgi:hypothetical protein